MVLILVREITNQKIGSQVSGKPKSCVGKRSWVKGSRMTGGRNVLPVGDRGSRPKSGGATGEGQGSVLQRQGGDVPGRLEGRYKSL